MPLRFAGAGTPMWSNCTPAILLGAIWRGLHLLLGLLVLEELDLEALDDRFPGGEVEFSLELARP
jgi:hypothetical protein